MNEQLKFSWGHIVAFLALIIICYISFVGITYWTDGNFAKAGILTLVIIVALFLLFIGAQILKATERKFARCIWVERILIFGSPVIFFLAMLGYFHFWTVHSQNKAIVDKFNNAIQASEQMFKDYKLYSDERIRNYTEMLDRVIVNRNGRPKEFGDCGFVQGKEEVQKKNMVETLRLQLLSTNYDTLRVVATEWINSSSQGKSTFNVFLLGNIKEIKAAIHAWNDMLGKFAEKKLSNEEFNGYNKVSDWGKYSNLSSVDDGLDKLTYMFTTTGKFSGVMSIITSILLYLALLFPYLLQDRHTKSMQRLINMKQGADDEGGFSIPFIKSIGKQRKQEPNPSPMSDDDDDYKSFSL